MNSTLARSKCSSAFVPELQSAVLHFWEIGYEFNILQCLLVQAKRIHPYSSYFSEVLQNLQSCWNWKTPSISNLPRSSKIFQESKLSLTSQSPVDSRTCLWHWLDMTWIDCGQVAAALVAIQEAAAGANVSSYHDKGGRRWHSCIKHHESVSAGFTMSSDPCAASALILQAVPCHPVSQSQIPTSGCTRLIMAYPSCITLWTFKLWNELHSLLHSSTVSFSLGCIFTLTLPTLPCYFRFSAPRSWMQMPRTCSQEALHSPWPLHPPMQVTVRSSSSLVTCETLKCQAYDVLLWGGWHKLWWYLYGLCVHTHRY